MEEKTLVLEDGYKIFYRVWRAGEERATLHINHGMAEYSLRYDAFASFLCKNGITVIAQDHRGHGETKDINDGGKKGFFAPSDGWNIVCNDSAEIDERISLSHEGVKHIVFGHSMGSFLTRTNIARHSELYDGAIIMGTGCSQSLVGKMGHMIANKHVKKYGADHTDESLDHLAFSSYGNKFDKKTEGKFCWLSQDRNEVKKYENDEDCGFVCTSSFYRDLIEGIAIANDKKLISKCRKDLPLLFLSGSMDPVGSYGKGVLKSASLYKKAGISDTETKLYKDGRHEILNDKMRDEVYQDVLNFVNKVINGK